MRKKRAVKDIELRGHDAYSDWKGKATHAEMMLAFECGVVKSALQWDRGNIKKAAERINMSRPNLYHRVRKFELTEFVKKLKKEFDQ